MAAKKNWKKFIFKKGDDSCCDTGSKGGVYCLTVIGALVYFIQHATSFWMGVLGVLKAAVWPALVMYKVLELLKIQ